MKICIVVPYFTPYIRGNEYGLAASLSKLEHDVTILTSMGRAPREKMVVGEKDYSSLSLTFKVKYLFTLLDLGENPIVLGVFIHMLREKYDLVMLQEDYPFICHLAFLAAKIKGIPVILSTERTYYPEIFWKRIILKFFDLTLNKLLRKKADLYTAHCTAAKEFIVQKLGVREERIKVIPVGVDTNLFKPIENANLLGNGDKFKILCVARLHKYKGLDYLIKAMKLVKERIPNSKLYILGKGHEEGNLRKLVEELNLKECVEFIQNPIPNHKMPELYSSCDVYVQPSVVEPFGIAVLEAMACGKPVIGTKVGGMLDTIKDGESGYLVKLQDSSELTNSIISIAEGPDKRIKMGGSARLRAIEFDWNTICLSYMKLIYQKGWII
jgi:glycosyltransferase involved in cell wall biosynthesis